MHWWRVLWFRSCGGFLLGPQARKIVPQTATGRSKVAAQACSLGSSSREISQRQARSFYFLCLCVILRKCREVRLEKRDSEMSENDQLKRNTNKSEIRSKKRRRVRRMTVPLSRTDVNSLTQGTKYTQKMLFRHLIERSVRKKCPKMAVSLVFMVNIGRL